jgi:dihydrolipoamide dehydrogenase
METGAQVLGIDSDSNKLSVRYLRRSKEVRLETDLVLVAAGRRPFTEDLGARELGIVGDRGQIQVDEKLRTSLPDIYAIGDVTGSMMLAHVASYHGELAAEIIAGMDRRVQDEPIPACVFTLPQIAWVGPSEEQARKALTPYRTSMFSLSASGKALALGEPKGWVKLMENAHTGKLIAAHLVGPGVSELVGELTLAIRSGMSAAELAETIHPHPTLSEALKEAALGFGGSPIHAAPNVRSFDAT